MPRRFISSVIALIVAGQSFAVDREQLVTDRAREIDAKCWFNAQPVRLFDPPKLILLEFWSVRSRESREVLGMMRALQRFSEDNPLLVVALTADECEKVQRFLRHEQIKYKVGAESRSLKHYGVEELPTVVLIDAREQRIIRRWSGRGVKAETIAQAIQEFFKAPQISVSVSGALSPEQKVAFDEIVAGVDVRLSGLTEETLAIDGEIGPEALASFDRFYADNLAENPAQDDGATRAADYARTRIVSSQDTGYGKLISSGQLSTAARNAIRDRLLEIARNDPSGPVRMSAIYGLRSLVAQPGDSVLLDALRDMRQSVGSVEDAAENPFIREALDEVLEDFEPKTQSTTSDETGTQLNAYRLRRMFRESPDPASSQWAEAHAYLQTVADRNSDQLLEDYWSFEDPPGDEIGVQNAVLKRKAALDELGHQIVRSRIRDLPGVKDQLARALSKEPNWSIRNDLVIRLVEIAKRGKPALRAEIVELFQKRMSAETNRYVLSTLEAFAHELQQQ